MIKRIIAIMLFIGLTACERKEPEVPVKVKCIQVHDVLTNWADSRWAIYERLDTHERRASCRILALPGEEFAIKWSELTCSF